jgi:hypothetical protein
MPKRILIILSLLVVAFLAYSQSTYVVWAEKPTLNTGTTVSECIFLEEGLYIKVNRVTDKNSPFYLCAPETIELHRDAMCTQIVDKIPFIDGAKPSVEAYGVGNKPCKESIVVYKKGNPTKCFEYHSGCRTRYIPRG